MSVIEETRRLFRRIVCHDVFDADGQPHDLADDVRRCVETRECQIDRRDDGTVALLLPVCKGLEVVSVVGFETNAMMNATSGTPVVGVMEVWQPTGQYDDLGLVDGAYGELDRFENVSSYVRFESGIGLPGLVWKNGQSILQNDLQENVGFLRSAGASAGALETALGMPVGDQSPSSALLLLSSSISPIADAIEVWAVEDDRVVLSQSSYADSVDLGLRRQIGEVNDFDHGLVGLALQHEGATTTANAVILDAGCAKSTSNANPSFGWQFGLAIPIFRDASIAEVVTFLMRQA